MAIVNLIILYKQLCLLCHSFQLRQGSVHQKLQLRYLQYKTDSPTKLPAPAASSLANDSAWHINQTSTMDCMNYIGFKKNHQKMKIYNDLLNLTYNHHFFFKKAKLLFQWVDKVTDWEKNKIAIINIWPLNPKASFVLLVLGCDSVG